MLPNANTKKCNCLQESFLIGPKPPTFDSLLYVRMTSDIDYSNKVVLAPMVRETKLGEKSFTLRRLTTLPPFLLQTGACGCLAFPADST